jgi:4-hydroxybutyrate CoA-transferase
MDWKEEYKKKLVSPEAAVKAVKSGDRVMVPLGADPKILTEALFNRKDELRGVEIMAIAPASNPGWYSPGCEESFSTTMQMFVHHTAREGTDAKRTDFIPMLFSTEFKAIDEKLPERREIDVVLTICTKPNRHGFVNSGPFLWDRFSYAGRAKKVLMEVHPDLPTVFGDNMMHVSEIDHFIEGPHYMTDDEIKPFLAPLEAEKKKKLEEIIKAIERSRRGSMVPLLVEMSLEEIAYYESLYGLSEPPDDMKAICGYVGELVKDGDTIQIGAGSAINWLPKLGIFDNKVDLGYHAEMAARGIGKLVEGGVITGKYKTIHKGLAVAAAWSGIDNDDLDYIAENPKFHLYPNEYTNNIKTISAHDNMVAVNTCLSVDFTGQINSETVAGNRIFNGHGGQPEFAIGSFLSKGGRNLSLLPSTALGGVVSRIVPRFEEGACVTIPRYFADYIVTEYGYTRLIGKPFRERAMDLIGIAHPDFRAELTREARRMFWP